jgi:hypothetical protein
MAISSNLTEHPAISQRNEVIKLSGLFSALLCLSACGPDITDGTTSNTGKYFLSDFGGNERQIVREPKGQRGLIVIDARVDHFVRDGAKIFLARRPKRFQRNDDGMIAGVLTNTCEYWTIDTESHNVRLSEKDPRISCRG